MKIIIKENNELDSSLCRELIADAENGIRNLFVPAGGTPEGFYQHLASRSEPIWDTFKFFQVDDILNGPKAREFDNFFRTNLRNRMSQLVGVEEDTFPEGQFSSFLGLGVNGHVAFHEPHLPKHFTKGCVELGPRTLNYLGLEKGTWGITYGLGVFLQSESIYLMVKGHHKLEILRRFLEDDSSVPAVELKRHKGLKLLVDEETWALLGNEFKSLRAS